MIFLFIALFFIAIILVVAQAHKESHIVAKVNIKSTLEKSFEYFMDTNHLQIWLEGFKQTQNDEEIFLKINGEIQRIKILKIDINENKELNLKIKTKYFSGETRFVFYARNSTETLIVNFNIWKINNTFYRFLFFMFKGKIKRNLTDNLELLGNLIENQKNI